MNSVRHSTQEHSENGLLHHLLYAPSLLNLMSKNIFKNIFVLVHTFVLDLWSFSSLIPFGGGSNVEVRPPLRNIYSLWIAWTWLNIIKKVSDFSKLPDADCAFSAEQLKSLVWFVMTPTVSGYWGYVELEQWSRNLVDVGLSLGTGLLSDSGSVAPWSWGHLAWPPSWFD